MVAGGTGEEGVPLATQVPWACPPGSFYRVLLVETVRRPARGCDPGFRCIRLVSQQAVALLTFRCKLCLGGGSPGVLGPAAPRLPGPRPSGVGENWPGVCRIRPSLSRGLGGPERRTELPGPSRPQRRHPWLRPPWGHTLTRCRSLLAGVDASGSPCCISPPPGSSPPPPTSRVNGYRRQAVEVGSRWLYQRQNSVTLLWG